MLVADSALLRQTLLVIYPLKIVRINLVTVQNVTGEKYDCYSVAAESVGNFFTALIKNELMQQKRCLKST